MQHPPDTAGLKRLTLLGARIAIDAVLRELCEGIDAEPTKTEPHALLEWENDLMVVLAPPNEELTGELRNALNRAATLDARIMVC